MKVERSPTGSAIGMPVESKTSTTRRYHLAGDERESVSSRKRDSRELSTYPMIQVKNANAPAAFWMLSSIPRDPTASLTSGKDGRL